MFLLFLIFWIFRLFGYFIDYQVTELKPEKLYFNKKVSPIINYLFWKCIIIPYLNAYLTLYMISQRANKVVSFKWGQEVNINVENVYKFFEVLKLLIIRIVVIIFTGFSIGIYKEAKKLARLLIECYNDLMDSGSDDKSLKHVFYFWMFNALMKEIKQTNKLEQLRIYKSAKDLFTFNPDKELMNQLSRILYPKLNLIFPESVFEKKISVFLNEASKTLYDESKHQHFIVGNSDPHYGNYIKLSDKGIKYNLITNWTSTEKTFRNKNLVMNEKSYLVNPYIIKSKNIKVLGEYYIQNPLDNRLICDEFNITELWSLSWLGQKEYNYVNKHLISDYFKKNSLKDLITIYGGEPSNSKLFDIEDEMKRSFIKYNINLNPEKLFKLALTENLHNNYDLLLYWVNKLKNK